MNTQQLFQPIVERLQGSANVSVVYGEPIVAARKTIVPVARVGYGFGAGGGVRTKSTDEAPGEEGGGGGGGISVNPIGVIEISETSTRFIAFVTSKRLLVALATGFTLGFLLGKRSAERQALEW